MCKKVSKCWFLTNFPILCAWICPMMWIMIVIIVHKSQKCQKSRSSHWSWDLAIYQESCQKEKTPECSCQILRKYRQKISLETCNHCKESESQKWQKKSQISVLTIYFHELDHSEWFGAKKIFEKFWRIIQYGHFRPLWLRGENCIFWTGFFPDLKFSGIVPSNIIYHFWKFQQNR